MHVFIQLERHQVYAHHKTGFIQVEKIWTVNQLCVQYLIILINLPELYLMARRIEAMGLLYLSFLSLFNKHEPLRSPPMDLRIEYLVYKCEFPFLTKA